MRIRVLGSAAGGGFPQWNCGCSNCRGMRRGTLQGLPRTQECVAISADDLHWYLLNASPEIRGQIESFSELWPRGPRHTPIAGVVLTNGDVNHCLGLFSLRESQPISLYSTQAVRIGLTENAIFRTLERSPDGVRFVDLPLQREIELGHGLFITAIPARGKRPLHLEGPASPEDNIGLLIRHDGGTLAYFPAVAARTPAIDAALASAAVIFFDGTFWRNDELIAQELGTKRAEEMAHWPIGGDEGSLSYLSRFSAARRILIHINNTNPVLRKDSKERRALENGGIEVALDGMEVAL